MTSSIQQIEAALAHVQLPLSKPGVLPVAKTAVSSCSFDLGRKFEPAERESQAAIALAQIDSPQFCKPLRHIGTVAQAPRPDLLANKKLADQRQQRQSYECQASGATIVDSIASESVASESVASAPTESQSSSTKTVQVISHTPEPLTSEHTAEQSEQAHISKTCSKPPGIRPIQEIDTPDLPRSKSPKFTSHRNGSNPMLPLNLLQDIGKEVVQWQAKLKAVHDAIQALYGEGPIINAWLESASDNRSTSTEQGEKTAASPHLYSGGYQICGLDQSGQVWRKVCPPEQLPQVTVAIARHQKLRQLMSQKQSLDDRLQRLSQTLTMLRGGLRAY